MTTPHKSRFLRKYGVSDPAGDELELMEQRLAHSRGYSEPPVWVFLLLIAGVSVLLAFTIPT